jgi:lysozyme family protein
MDDIATSVRFQACMPFILQEEGGYSNDSHDPGGMTMNGIIQREYDTYRKAHGEPTQWVKNIAPAERDEIYWTSYWMPHCPTLPVGLDLSYFNIAVNGGPTRATSLLQSALNITSDGIWGDNTAAAIAAIDDVVTAINTFAVDEKAWYRRLRNFKYFGTDWLGRAERCRVLSIKMATATDSAESA